MNELGGFKAFEDFEWNNESLLLTEGMSKAVWHSTKRIQTISVATNDELWYKQFNTL